MDIALGDHYSALCFVKGAPKRDDFSEVTLFDAFQSVGQEISQPQFLATMQWSSCTCRHTPDLAAL